MKTFYVDCPFCDGMMEIDAETGKMIKKWAASEKLSTNQDKMQAALQKLELEKRSARQYWVTRANASPTKRKKQIIYLNNRWKRLKKKVFQKNLKTLLISTKKKT